MCTQTIHIEGRVVRCIADHRTQKNGHLAFGDRGMIMWRTYAS